MADRNDIATVIQSALAEIGVTGELHVRMDDCTLNAPLGDVSGDDMNVTVQVEPSRKPLKLGSAVA